jgi:hypothetical protein
MSIRSVLVAADLGPQVLRTTSAGDAVASDATEVVHADADANGDDSAAETLVPSSSSSSEDAGGRSTAAGTTHACCLRRVRSTGIAEGKVEEEAEGRYEPDEARGRRDAESAATASST